MYVWNADTGEETYIYERPLGVNNNKATTSDDVPIVNCVVYHPFDHIVAFSGIGKHPINGMPLPVCLYRFDKSSNLHEEPATTNVNMPLTFDTVPGIKPPAFFDANNQYKDKLSPLKYNSLPSKENNEDNVNETRNEGKPNSKPTPQSPEKLKSMLHELDQLLLEKSYK